MVESQDMAAEEQPNMFYDDENPFTSDILDRPDLFYGNPDELADSQNSTYTNGQHMDGGVDSAFHSGWHGDMDDSGSLDVAAIRGMVRKEMTLPIIFTKEMYFNYDSNGKIEKKDLRDIHFY